MQFDIPQILRDLGPDDGTTATAHCPASGQYVGSGRPGGRYGHAKTPRYMCPVCETYRTPTARGFMPSHKARAHVIRNWAERQALNEGNKPQAYRAQAWRLVEIRPEDGAQHYEGGRGGVLWLTGYNRAEGVRVGATGRMEYRAGGSGALWWFHPDRCAVKPPRFRDSKGDEVPGDYIRACGNVLPCPIHSKGDQ